MYVFSDLRGDMRFWIQAQRINSDNNKSSESQKTRHITKCQFFFIVIDKLLFENLGY